MWTSGFVIPLALYAGKKVIDLISEGLSSGQTPVVDQAGNIGAVYNNQGRTIVDRNFTASAYVASELIFGNFYIPDTVEILMTGEELALVVVIEVQTQNMLFFPADPGFEYELYLPHGVYSFFVLLLDTDVDDLMDAEIFAIGFPSAVDMSNIEDFQLQTHDDVWELLDFDAYPVDFGGPYYLDFILIDTLDEPEFPTFLFELFLD